MSEIDDCRLKVTATEITCCWGQSE